MKKNQSKNFELIQALRATQQPGRGKKTCPPTAMELFQAFDFVSRELETLEDLTSPNPKFLSHPELSKPIAGFLSGLTKYQEDLRLFDIKLKEAIHKEALRLATALSMEPTIAWIESRDGYIELQKSLKHHASRNRGSSLDQPIARFKLLQATLISVGGHYRNIEQGKKPGCMASKDWKRAIKAVSTLRSLQDHNGLRLWKAFAPSASLPIDWVQKLESRLIDEETRARNPYDDKLTSDRAAARRFTDWLLIYFDKAPASMVEKFTQLIDYKTTSMPRHVKQWENAFRTHSLS